MGQKAIEFLNSDEGPTATEYAIMLALIAIGVMVAMAAFGDRMTAIYTSIHAKTPDL
ncbi:MAG: Flp family type IVb pilin [Planctomycetes bacterium]|nr:Flp family type IVb pilin [Planctomycetota bacterium]